MQAYPHGLRLGRRPLAQVGPGAPLLSPSLLVSPKGRAPPHPFLRPFFSLCCKPFLREGPGFSLACYRGTLSGLQGTELHHM